MSETIMVSFFDSGNDINSTKQFLQAHCMTFNNGLKNHCFFIELRVKPSILTRLEAAGYFREGERSNWDLMGVNDGGITIYLCHMEAGDGYVFIPFSNIVSIHTADDNWLKRLN